MLSRIEETEDYKVSYTYQEPFKIGKVDYFSNDIVAKIDKEVKGKFSDNKYVTLVIIWIADKEGITKFIENLVKENNNLIIGIPRDLRNAGIIKEYCKEHLKEYKIEDFDFSTKFYFTDIFYNLQEERKHDDVE